MAPERTWTSRLTPKTKSLGICILAIGVWQFSICFRAFNTLPGQFPGDSANGRPIFPDELACMAGTQGRIGVSLVISMLVIALGVRLMRAGEGSAIAGTPSCITYGTLLTICGALLIAEGVSTNGEAKDADDFTNRAWEDAMKTYCTTTMKTAKDACDMSGRPSSNSAGSLAFGAATNDRCMKTTAKAKRACVTRDNKCGRLSSNAKQMVAGGAVLLTFGTLAIGRCFYRGGYGAGLRERMARPARGRTKTPGSASASPDAASSRSRRARSA